MLVYDALTGKIVKKLRGQQTCVRDVSWHPYYHELVSSSWDTTVMKWKYQEAVREPGERSRSGYNYDLCSSNPSKRMHLLC
jgi:WD40 repeat protein